MRRILTALLAAGLPLLALGQSPASNVQQNLSTNAFQNTQGSIVSAAAADITNGLNLACWGDSLTFGANATSQAFSFPSTLAAQLGYFTYNGGVGGNTSAQILTRMNADPSSFGYPTVIWAGRNDVSQSVSQATTLANIASMVANLNSNRFVILSIPNQNLSTEWSGTTTYNTIIALNAALAAAYPNNYLDVRTYLVSLYNAALPQDVIDHGHDVPPTSLRERPTVTVSSMTESSTTVTVNCSLTNLISSGLSIGNTVLVAGANQSGYNGLQTVTFVDGGGAYFQFTAASGLTSPATGSITAGFVDPLHYSNSGYADVATYIEAHLAYLQGYYPAILTPTNAINYFNSPPIIGGLVPNSGNFTTLNLTSTTGGLTFPGGQLIPAFSTNSPEITLTQNGVTQALQLESDGSGWYIPSGYIQAPYFKTSGSIVKSTQIGANTTNPQSGFALDTNGAAITRGDHYVTGTLHLGNAYVGGTPTANGTVTLTDSNGISVQVLIVHP